MLSKKWEEIISCGWRFVMLIRGSLPENSSIGMVKRENNYYSIAYFDFFGDIITSNYKTETIYPWILYLSCEECKKLIEFIIGLEYPLGFTTRVEDDNRIALDFWYKRMYVSQVEFVPPDSYFGDIFFAKNLILEYSKTTISSRIIEEYLKVKKLTAK